MRTAIALAALALCSCTITLHEDPKLLEAIDANTAHLDRLTLSIDGARPAAKRELPKHVVCRPNEQGNKVLVPVEAVGKGEKDLGAVASCPPPNDGAPCIGGEAFSNVEARCQQGKL